MSVTLGKFKYFTDKLVLFRLEDPPWSLLLCDYSRHIIIRLIRSCKMRENGRKSTFPL